MEKLSATASAEAFDHAIVPLMEQVRAGSTRGKRRWVEMSVPTLYSLVGRIRKRRRPDPRRQREDRKGQRAGDEAGAGAAAEHKDADS